MSLKIGNSFMLPRYIESVCEIGAELTCKVGARRP